MLCPNCGTKFHPGDSFCYVCGAALPEQAVVQGEAGTNQSSIPPSLESGPQGYAATAPALAPDPPQENAPPPPLAPDFVPPPIAAETAPQIVPARYARFILLTLTLNVCASIALLFMVQGAIMHSQKQIYLRAAPLFLVALVLAKLLADQSREIKAHMEPRKFTNLVNAALAVAFMFLAVAGATGFQLGARRFAFDQMIADWRHLSEVGRQVSSQRNAVNHQDIPAHVQMYKAIEKDVAEMDATTQRLMEKERSFVERYPDYSAESDKEMEDLDKVHRRAVLLGKQIEVARRISSQPNNQQVVMWVTEMEPLLQEEAQLDHPSQSNAE